MMAPTAERRAAPTFVRPSGWTPSTTDDVCPKGSSNTPPEFETELHFNFGLRVSGFVCAYANSRPERHEANRAVQNLRTSWVLSLLRHESPCGDMRDRVLETSRIRRPAI